MIVKLQWNYGGNEVYIMGTFTNRESMWKMKRI